jgi:hypothetical protein
MKMFITQIFIFFKDKILVFIKEYLLFLVQNIYKDLILFLQETKKYILKKHNILF